MHIIQHNIYLIFGMGSLHCCQNKQEYNSFKQYCKIYSTPQYSKYLQAVRQQPTNVYEEHGQTVIGDWDDASNRTGKGIIFCAFNFYYEGSIVDSKANGKGRIVLPKKIIYQGYTQNNSANGEGQLHFQQEQIKLKGLWSNGLPVINSKMQLSIINNKSFITFLPQGQNDHQLTDQNIYQVKIQFQNGNSYQGQISRHGDIYQITGKGKMIFVDGSYYKGEFKKGKMHGFGQYNWKNTGHWYEGQYRQNIREGKGKYYYNNSRFKEGKWIGGIYHKQTNAIQQQ